MKKKERILEIVMVIVLIISIAITYYQTIIKKSFEVINIEPDSNVQNNNE